MTINDTYGRSEFTKREKALEDRKKLQHTKAIEGRAKATIDHILSNGKQMTIKEIERYIKKERSRVAIAWQEKYSVYVTAGLKEFLHNYFLTK